MFFDEFNFRNPVGFDFYTKLFFTYLAGADSWDIAVRLGHSKEMVETRYSHMFLEKKKKMKKLLNDS